VTHTKSLGRVLVVDDNEAFCHSTAEILQLAGHEAVGVRGAEEARPVLAQGDVALVLLDVGVDFTGLRLLPEIREPTRVILVSGGLDCRRVPRVGPKFLTKPVTPQLLLAEVENHLRPTG